MRARVAVRLVAELGFLWQVGLAALLPSSGRRSLGRERAQRKAPPRLMRATGAIQAGGWGEPQADRAAGGWGEPHADRQKLALGMRRLMCARPRCDFAPMGGPGRALKVLRIGQPIRKPVPTRFKNTSRKNEGETTYFTVWSTSPERGLRTGHHSGNDVPAPIQGTWDMKLRAGRFGYALVTSLEPNKIHFGRSDSLY